MALELRYSILVQFGSCIQCTMNHLSNKYFHLKYQTLSQVGNLLFSTNNTLHTLKSIFEFLNFLQKQTLNNIQLQATECVYVPRHSKTRCLSIDSDRKKI